MNADNPYQAPKPATNPETATPSLLMWSVATVFGCSILGGILGLAIGASLGSLVPGYYRSVFSTGHQAGFDPLAVGIGQGLTQGVVFGGVVSLVLVALFYWYNLRAVNRAG